MVHRYVYRSSDVKQKREKVNQKSKLELVKINFNGVLIPSFHRKKSKNCVGKINDKSKTLTLLSFAQHDVEKTIEMDD